MIGPFFAAALNPLIKACLILAGAILAALAEMFADAAESVSTQASRMD